LVVDVEEPPATTTVKSEPEKTEVPVEITIEKVETNEVLPKRAVDNSPVDPFEALLEASLEWIEQSDKTRGTIQVMTIGFDKFVPATFLEYLAQLESYEVDVKQIRVFPSMAGGKVVYSIFYGEYESHREAGLGIKNLPEALRANSPISRTIGSIAKQIARFQEATGEN
ncbi:MAG: hypothetical protein OEY09_13690, partial [Gammaproteobacteria bacterium]|nr:hypothetical protein [Gammaproteobacteria bacterium]